MAEQAKGFKRVKCCVDFKSNRKYVELVEIGSKKPKRFDWTPKVWVLDEKADGAVTDIYGRKVRPYTILDAEKKLDPRGESCCEGDIAGESLFLLERYGDKEIVGNISDFAVATIDIEVAAGNGGYLPNHNVTFKRTTDGELEHATLAELEEIEGHNKFLVVENGGFKTYRDSVFAKADFPDPISAKYPVNLITVHDSRTNLTTTFGLGEYTGSQKFEYKAYKSEESMLNAFFDWFAWKEFDIITGWNSDHYDLVYLVNRSIELYGLGKERNHLSNMSPMGYVPYVKRGKIAREDEAVKIPGLYILDYLALYKKFTYVTEPSYKLDYIGQKVTGEGKVEYEGSISNFYKKDWNRFVEYNIQDVLLVRKIDDKKRFLDLAVTVAYQALIPIDRVFSSVATIEGYMMRYLHGQRKVLPNRPAHKREDWWTKELMFDAEELKDPSDPSSGKVRVLQNIRDEYKDFVKAALDVHSGAPSGMSQSERSKLITAWKKTYKRTWEQGSSDLDNMVEDLEHDTKGGHVEAIPGLYTSSLCFDVASLYPHIIIQYNISPETKVTIHDDCDKSGLIESEINGVWFRREKGIIPAIVKRIFDERSMFKKKMFKETPGTDIYNYYNSMQQVRKILINSMYGVMINEYFHFYDPDLARAITRGGRVLIRFLTEKGEKAVRMLARKPEVLFPNAKPFEPKSNILSLIDTDSNHLHFSEYHEHLAPEMDEREFLRKMEVFMEAAFAHALKKKADVKGLEQVIKFKREGVITHELVVAKKHYVSVMIQNEDEIYDKPKTKYTGVEIKRSDVPTWVRKKMIETLDFVFSGCTEQQLLSRIDGIYEEFMNQPLEEICSVGSVSNYHKYTIQKEKRAQEADAGGFAQFMVPEENTKSEALVFMDGTPMRNKAAIAYNRFIKKNNLPYEKIGDGSKIRYVPVKDLETFGNDVIAWVDKCPKEIRERLDIDYEKQFETFTGFIDSVCETVGFHLWSPKSGFEQFMEV